MNVAERRWIAPVPGFRSSEVASFLAQLDDQTRRLTESTRGLSSETLAWQPGPGVNTIGMLLAHIAIVEVYWSHRGLENAGAPYPYKDILGIGEDDDGMPLAPHGRPPSTLAGKSLSFFDDLIERGRAHLRRTARSITDEGLDQELIFKRKDGSEVALNRRWTLYHLLEHFSGHYGQILLLLHLHRASLPAK